MDEVETKKQERSKSKMAVTRAARRIIGSTHRDVEFEVLKGLIVELEKVYDDFCTTCEEYELLVSDEKFVEHRVVNGDELKTYKANVEQTYQQARNVYIHLKSENDKFKQNLTMAPLTTAIKRDMNRLKNYISAVEENLSKETPSYESLHMDKGDMEKLLDEICDKVAKLSVIEQDTELQEGVEAIIDTAYSTLRNVNLCLRLNQNPKVTVASPNDGVSPVNTESSSSTLISSITSHSETQASSSTTMPVEPTDIGNPTNLQPTGVPAVTPSPSAVYTTMDITSQQYHPTGSMSTVSSLHLPVSQPATLPASITPPFPGSVAYTTASPSVISSAYNLLTHPTSDLSVLTQASSPLTQSWYHNTPPAQSIGFAQHTRPAQPYVFQQPYPATPPINNNANINLKKTPLPTFSGHRRDWPEFKAVWKQLAESVYTNKTALAHELKRSVKGEAIQRIRSVYITRPEAYDEMWKKLEVHYDDVSASVQAALSGFQRLRPVESEDYKALVELVDEVEAAFCQLQELSHLDVLTMRDVDHISKFLPSHVRVEWIRKYQDLPSTEKIKPFPHFMKFLNREREAIARLAESQPVKKKFARQHYQTSAGSRSTKFYKCAYPAHRKDHINHTTSECKEFQKLPVSGKQGRYEVLKQVNACFKCFGNHKKQECPRKDPCPTCGSQLHHILLCKEKSPKDKPENTPELEQPKPNDGSREGTSSHMIQSDTIALYPINQAIVVESGRTVSVFCDGGSNSSYITHRAANKIKAKTIRELTLDVTTMGNVEKSYSTREYQFTIRTSTGRKVTINAFGMERITGPVSKLDPEVLVRLFPDHDPESLQRKSTNVDVLLGCDHFGLHPKKEEAQCGDNLSIMSGELGICLQGTHPDLKEETRYDTNLAKTIHDVRRKTQTYFARIDDHPEFTRRVTSPERPNESADIFHCQSHAARSKSDRETDSQVENFIRGEELATETSPRCGGCRCNKCPTVGHTYSFREEQELRMIRENLEYDEKNQCWRTSYPWLVDPNSLPNNYSTALATLRNTERVLSKDKNWAETYEEQLKDMVRRHVARKLSPQELEEWKGPLFYISHLAVVNPRSNSTPVRIVFNSSQCHHGVSLNSCLAKGPDAYINNLVGILLRWREEQVAFVGDLKKMFNSIYLKSLEQHCHRFLWRDMNTEREPDIYVMERVNMGDSPAPAISTEAVYQTATLFEDESPEAAELLRKSSYVDDLIDSQPTKPGALKLAQNTENMLHKGGFVLKCWQFSGEENTRASGELHEVIDSAEQKPNNLSPGRSLLKGSDENLRVLGVGWKPKEDVIVFEVVLNFSHKRRGIRTGPNLLLPDLPQSLPDILTKRLVLQQVMKIYDPLGLVSPFTLIGKIYLRETWTRNLGWDDQLPVDLREKWVKFFISLFELEKLHLPRCLRPPNAVGDPWLVILSDGSDIAYGFVAYIRWILEDSSPWCRLIMSKCRVAPVNKLSTPQMELNAAVLSKRGRKVIEQEARFHFERVLQIVDSETVLNMINKTSTRFKVYEGVRLGEIQAATDGDMSCWAWTSGKNNTADWLTRGKSPQDLDEASEWWNGPAILYRPVEEWGLKFGSQKEECLPGEKKLRSTCTTTSSPSLIDYERFSDINKVIWIVARILGIMQVRSFRGGKTMSVTPEMLRAAETFIVKDTQKVMKEELSKTDKKGRKGGRYATLSPVLSANGVWLVGKRLIQLNPMTLDSSLQMLLPYPSRVTYLLMRRAHRQGHRGRDGTLAKFREMYWVPQGSKLAQKVKHNCQLCKLRQAKLLQQEMGQLPAARLKPAPPFTHVMLDLFGPYVVRGEVQKRVSGKAYGVVFTDLVFGAIHIEAVYGYDTPSFLMALSRFASVRGWPSCIYSDPGSQLVGADRELKEAWNKIDRELLHKDCAHNGLTWHFGPADSPWNQGKVESMVKAAKRAIHFAVHNSRLSAPEFLTICYEAANLLNERPIGTLPKTDSCLNVLTPNTLLLGRACAKNPGEWQPSRQNIANRYHLVQATVNDFWSKWIELCAPALVSSYKWTTPSRSVRNGDVVLIADKSSLKGDYRLGIVQEFARVKMGKYEVRWLSTRIIKLVKGTTSIQLAKKWLYLAASIV